MTEANRDGWTGVAWSFSVYSGRLEINEEAGARCSMGSADGIGRDAHISANSCRGAPGGVLALGCFYVADAAGDRLVDRPERRRQGHAAAGIARNLRAPGKRVVRNRVDALSPMSTSVSASMRTQGGTTTSDPRAAAFGLSAARNRTKAIWPRHRRVHRTRAAILDIGRLADPIRRAMILRLKFRRGEFRAGKYC